MLFMESTGLRMRTLNFTSAFLLRYTHRTRPFFRTDLKSLFSHKPYKISLQSIRYSFRQFTHRCSAESSYLTDQSHDVDGVSIEASDKMLQVVLVSPQIPGNTGCIARTCAASAVGLHLVEPLGFQVDDAKLKRAGLDYWPYVVVKVHGSWGEFIEYFQRQEGEKRLLAFTKRGTATHSDFSYKRGDWLVFGAETFGLPPEALLDCENEPFGGGTVRIPMIETYVRCLNLSVSVGIALYEAARQLNYEQLQLPQGPCINNQQLFVKEDIFA